MPETQKTQGRRKFDVSLVQLSRPGVQSHHFKTYKPPDMVTKAARKCETETNELTPQQAARKRYEERNLELRRKKARERMAQRRAQDHERERETQRQYEEKYRRKHREQRRYEEDRRRSLRYIERHGAKSFHHYLQRRNGRLQRPNDYTESG
ncbi:hypothetical protein EV361DRAFT_668964 [Lentinula raphanica]|nr:hypothetical protein EV361DRAFT_668964 [Lentinula raphanica]